MDYRAFEIAGVTVMVSPETERILRGREAFIAQYCRGKGWSTVIEELSWAQIAEIHGQEGWKNPV